MSKTGFTEEKLLALESAIAEGVKRVQYNDKVVEYRSIDEMMKVRDLMREKLGIKSSCGEKGLFGGRRIKASHSKGLNSIDVDLEQNFQKKY